MTAEEDSNGPNQAKGCLPMQRPRPTSPRAEADVAQAHCCSQNEVGEERETFLSLFLCSVSLTLLPQSRSFVRPWNQDGWQRRRHAHLILRPAAPSGCMQ